MAANQQVVTYMHPGAQQIYPGSQSGVVIIQPTGAVATALPPGFTTTGQQPMYIQQQVEIDIFSLYVLFSHFKSCDVLKGIFLLFFHKLCMHIHVHRTTFERKFSLE